MNSSSIKFLTGPVGSGKTLKLLIVIDQLVKCVGKKSIYLIKHSFDTRSKKLEFMSNAGLSCKTNIEVNSDFDLTTIDFTGIRYLIIDEIQFFSVKQIESLNKIAHEMDVSIICCGLTTDFRGKIFEPSKKLIEIADEIEQVTAICMLCKYSSENNNISLNAVKSMKITTTNNKKS
ncbi:KITH [Hepatospora eriocheir]|uniref:Thymidine kinase n=1 Tax=Hepatospora eriocheir TaxID=1081669 RepID=A0A1X0QGA1_9MICR|nr:KITH [Hepatospora eriocheir]